MYMFSIILCYNTLFVAPSHRIIRHRQLSNSNIIKARFKGSFMMLGHGRKTWQARLTLKTSRKLRELTTTRLENLSVITSHGAGPQLVGLGPPENYRYHSNLRSPVLVLIGRCQKSSPRR